MSDYVQGSNKSVYEIKKNINSNKDLNNMVEYLSGKKTKVDGKHAFDLIDRNLENR